jgi:hypothetical protein
MIRDQRRPTAILRHPAGPTRWDTEMAERIQRHTAHIPPGEQRDRTVALLLRAKLDGPAHKLAAILGTTAEEIQRRLRAGYVLLIHDPAFHATFHRLRSAL